MSPTRIKMTNDIVLESTITACYGANKARDDKHEPNKRDNKKCERYNARPHKILAGFFSRYVYFLQEFVLRL